MVNELFVVVGGVTHKATTVRKVIIEKKDPDQVASETGAKTMTTGSN